MIINYHDNNLKINKIIRKQQKKIVENGYSFKLKNMRMYFLKTNKCNMSKIVIIVSKKQLKKSSDRKKIKRRIKDAYRLNKYLINEIYFLIFIYKIKKMNKYEDIKKEMIILLSIL